MPLSRVRPRAAHRARALAASLLIASGCGGGSSSGTTGGAVHTDGTPSDGGSASGNARTVTGRVTYDLVPATYDPSTRTGTLDFARAAEKPVRNGTVAALEGGTVLASTTTSDDGRYSLSFTPAGTGPLSIVAAARTATPPIEVRDNTDQGALWSVGAAVDASTTTRDLHATHGWTGSAYDPSARSAAPFAILDTVLTASRALIGARAVSLPPLVVNWSPDNVPAAGATSAGDIQTTHYSPQDAQIYVLGKDGVDTDEFDDHVIVHEWGHFVEDNLSRSDSPGGQHGPGDVLDPRLSFGEGYGNALSAMLLATPIYADTAWSGPGGALGASGFDAESAPVPTDDPNPGPFSEMSITRLLYDLWDSGSGEAFDQVGLGLGPIVDVLVGPEKTTDALTTIASFVAGLKAQPGVDAGAVDVLLAHYRIGAITTAFGDGDPALRAMYTEVAAIPAGLTGSLGPGQLPNRRAQNQYFVLGGNGGNGGHVTVTATSAQDVALTLYRRGAVLSQADAGLTGTEQLGQDTQPGQRYVVVLTGFGQGTGSYPVTVNFSSP